jgi:cellulose synthase/poly-beta-1,6-N-acetylglucosamine synthase-like glycosyltransferase
MLRLLVLTAQATALGLAAYNAVTALWGWPDRTPAPVGERRRRLRVVVPAHDEAGVIGNLLADLDGSDYPPEHRETWVLADRCTDQTASVAASNGARVAQRSEGPGGKGAALAWYLREHPLQPAEALVVFDADNRVPPDALGRIADELDAGHRVVQCYLDVTDPDISLVAEASALSYWAGNRMVQLARSNLGWSADLGGTGMAFTPDALAAAGGFGDSLTEDQELGARLVLAGERVEWLHDVRIRDEKPSSVSVTARQRARWMAGKRAAAKLHARSLVMTGRPAALDQALRLVQPGRSFVALVSGVLTVASTTTRSAWLLPWQVWAVATAVQVLEPLPFLAREGVPARRLVRYPLLAVLAAMWIPIRLLSRRVKGWYHTPHGPVSGAGDDGPGQVP